MANPDLSCISHIKTLISDCPLMPYTSVNPAETSRSLYIFFEIFIYDLRTWHEKPRMLNEFAGAERPQIHSTA